MHFFLRDTAGQERFRFITNAYFRGAKVIVCGVAHPCGHHSGGGGHWFDNYLKGFMANNVPSFLGRAWHWSMTSRV